MIVFFVFFTFAPGLQLFNLLPAYGRFAANAASSKNFPMIPWILDWVVVGQQCGTGFENDGGEEEMLWILTDRAPLVNKPNTQLQKDDLSGSTVSFVRQGLQEDGINSLSVTQISSSARKKCSLFTELEFYSTTSGRSFFRLGKNVNLWWTV